MPWPDALAAVRAFLKGTGDKKQAELGLKAINATVRAYERETAELRRQAKG